MEVQISMGKYDMDIVKMKLSSLVSPDYNPRTISDEEFDNLKKSILKFGYSDPIIVNKRNNHIVAGNQRFKALTELNRENHGKYTKIDVVLVDLNPDDEKAFNIGHNQIGGEFDGQKLELLLHELETKEYDMSVTGFFDDIKDVDLSELVDDEAVEEIVDLVPQYVLTVRCVNQTQQDLLFDELKQKGYSVKAMKY